MSGRTDTEIAADLLEWVEEDDPDTGPDLHGEAADRLLERSVLLNKICFAINEAMGLIPDGADSYFDEIGIEARLPEICNLIRAGRLAQKATP